jgi:hypothetical protein
VTLKYAQISSQVEATCYNFARAGDSFEWYKRKLPQVTTSKLSLTCFLVWTWLLLLLWMNYQKECYMAICQMFSIKCSLTTVHFFNHIACKNWTPHCPEILEELCAIESGGFMLCPRGCGLCIGMLYWYYGRFPLNWIRLIGSVGWALHVCRRSWVRFPAGPLNTQGLKITEEKVLPLQLYLQMVRPGWDHPQCQQCAIGLQY